MSVRERHRRAMDGSAVRLRRRGSRPRGRRWRLVPVAVGVVVVLLVAATGKLFVWPSPAMVPKSADAVLVLPGGSGDRLPRALALMSHELAPVLVLPGGSTPAWRAANEQCATAQRYQVICPPDPGSTRGDARLARNLASQHRWGVVVVVTSRSNLTRARLDFDRCLGAGFGMASSTSHAGPLTKIRVVVDEWLGWIGDGLFHRSC
jgi:uncharacterized SAM-binding protein YcdF (DUF218 family)